MKCIWSRNSITVQVRRFPINYQMIVFQVFDNTKDNAKTKQCKKHFLNDARLWWYVLLQASFKEQRKNSNNFIFVPQDALAFTDASVFNSSVGETFKYSDEDKSNERATRVKATKRLLSDQSGNPGAWPCHCNLSAVGKSLKPSDSHSLQD